MLNMTTKLKVLPTFLCNNTIRKGKKKLEKITISYTRKAKPMGEHRKKQATCAIHASDFVGVGWPERNKKKKMTDTSWYRVVLCIIFGFDSSPPHIVSSVEPYALPMVFSLYVWLLESTGLGHWGWLVTWEKHYWATASATQGIHKIIIMHKKKKKKKFSEWITPDSWAEPNPPTNNIFRPLFLLRIAKKNTSHRKGREKKVFHSVNKIFDDRQLSV